MSDNRNNNKNKSDDLITFNINERKNTNETEKNILNDTINRDLELLDDCKEKNINDIINNLETDIKQNVVNNCDKTLKRHRNSNIKDIIMIKSLPKKKKRRTAKKIMDCLDTKDSNAIIAQDLTIMPMNNLVNLIDGNYNEPIYYFSDDEPLSSPKIVKENKIIMENIKTLDDLINLIDTYPITDNVTYNIDMTVLHNIKPNLKKLQSMIGMKSLKTHVVDQILYYLQGFHKMGGGGDFMHTVIYGPPGTGKTEVAKIIGKIFSKLGILSKDKFRKVTRSDLIAGYLGQTALKTRAAIKDCIGGVMFIDEAYALGNAEKRDSFAKECIDTLCEGLSDHKDDFMVIIAGYEEELKNCFFNFNQGLDSRFTWRFKTEDYSPEELMKIFEKKVHDAGWKIKDSAMNEKWFTNNMDYFKFYGRDMETLFAKVKIAHSRRVFCLDNSHKTIVTKKDLKIGLEMYISNDEVKNRKPNSDLSKRAHFSMYT